MWHWQVAVADIGFKDHGTANAAACHGSERDTCDCACGQPAHCRRIQLSASGLYIHLLLSQHIMQARRLRLLQGSENPRAAAANGRQKAAEHRPVQREMVRSP